MPTSTFFRQLGILTAITALALFAINQLEVLQPYANFSWISLTFFVVLTLAMFGVGWLTVNSKNKNAFTGTILGFTLAKIVFSFVVVLSYHQLTQPLSKAFVIPFFITYLVYTAFETWFLMKLGKQKR